MAITLLIIETNRFLRQNLLRHMDSDRFRIIEYERKPELKNILRRNEIDVVLLGLDELKHEGLLLLKMIKKVRPLTEVILINSGPQLSLSIEGMKLGAFDDFLVPLDTELLTSRIQEAYQAKKEKEKAKKLPDLSQYLQSGSTRTMDRFYFS